MNYTRIHINKQAKCIFTHTFEGSIEYILKEKTFYIDKVESIAYYNDKIVASGVNKADLFGVCTHAEDNMANQLAKVNHPFCLSYILLNGLPPCHACFKILDNLMDEYVCDTYVYIMKEISDHEKHLVRFYDFMRYKEYSLFYFKNGEYKQ